MIISRGKLFRRDGFRPESLGRAIAKLKGDVTVFQFQQTPITDGDAEDVRREIFERAFAGADRSAIDDPILFRFFSRIC